MPYFKDLREYINLLDEKGLLWRIKSPIKRETELMPLVRWQFRGLPEEQRKAFLFENVVDRKGKKFNVPVLVGGLAASRQIYTLGLGCSRQEEIGERWTQAQLHPIPPKLVKKGPVQEVIMKGEELEKVGLERFPFPVNTPGFGGVMRTTASHWFSKDPETGARNIGNYAGHVSTRNKMSIGLGRTQHLATHLIKAKKLGKPLEAALVVGVPPVFAYVSVAKIPYGVDELAVACGLAGEPLEVVKCQTVDIEVPANAEIVIEGKFSIEYMEPHTGSFGEYCGYMAEAHDCPVFELTCITHRKNPIFTSIASQMPPSESSKIRQIAYEQNLFKFLKYDCNNPSVLDVAFHETSGSWAFCVIQMAKTHNSQAWQALNGAAGYEAGIGKVFITVDEDIDPHDPESVIWALSFRMQPHRDSRITEGKVGVLDPSTAPPASPREEAVYPRPTGASALLIDATRKWPFPAVALPKKEYMEKAREIWEREGLPPLKPRKPWHGYTLGYWPESYERAAQANLKGMEEMFKLGAKLPKSEFNIDK